MQWWEPIRLFNKLRHAIYRKASCKADEKDVPGCEALSLHGHRSPRHQALEHHAQWQALDKTDRFRPCSARTWRRFLAVDSRHSLLHGSWSVEIGVRQVMRHMVSRCGPVPDLVRVPSVYRWEHQTVDEEHLYMWLLLPCVGVVTDLVGRQGLDQELSRCRHQEALHHRPGYQACVVWNTRWREVHSEQVGRWEIVEVTKTRLWSLKGSAQGVRQDDTRSWARYKSEGRVQYHWLRQDRGDPCQRNEECYTQDRDRNIKTGGESDHQGDGLWP